MWVWKLAGEVSCCSHPGGHDRSKSNEGGAMTVAEAFERVSDGEALGYLARYFGLGEWAGKEFTGAHFEMFGANSPHAMTADDLLAVSFLSVHVPARASLGILRDHADEISGHLKDPRLNLALEDIPLKDHDEYFGAGSPALSLWRIIRRDQRSRWGVGATTASKILARKRPALVPIFDSVVGHLTGFKNSDGTWRAWHETFATNPELVDRLRTLRSGSGLNHISLLRVLDVVLWMHGSQGTIETREMVDEVEER